METLNKHEYAISNVSVWKKTQDSAQIDTIAGSVNVKNEYSYSNMDYEDEDILKSYEVLHFGNGFQSVPNFP